MQRKRKQTQLEWVTKAPAKRTKMVAVAPVRRKGTVVSAPLLRQIKGLVASKKKDAADVTRSYSGGTTNLQCLTSSTNGATAASGTGLIDADADEALINYIDVRGIITNTAVLDLDPTLDYDAAVRKIYVWFNKPLLVASAAGTIPPVTEVLVSDAFSSLYVSDAANGGRFKVLSDKRYILGSNTYQATTAVGHARVSGKSMIPYHHRIKVNKMCKFVAPSVSGTNGGHYDSDVNAGRVDAGLIVCYTLMEGAPTSNINETWFTRLNYTA